MKKFFVPGIGFVNVRLTFSTPPPVVAKDEGSAKSQSGVVGNKMSDVLARMIPPCMYNLRHQRPFDGN